MEGDSVTARLRCLPNLVFIWERVRIFHPRHAFGRCKMGQRVSKKPGKRTSLHLGPVDLERPGKRHSQGNHGLHLDQWNAHRSGFDRFSQVPSSSRVLNHWDTVMRRAGPYESGGNGCSLPPEKVYGLGHGRAAEQKAVRIRAR